MIKNYFLNISLTSIKKKNFIIETLEYFDSSE